MVNILVNWLRQHPRNLAATAIVVLILMVVICFYVREVADSVHVTVPEITTKIERPTL